MKYIFESIKKLDNYITKEKFKGYDPYDTLQSPLIPKSLPNILKFVLIQIQKRNPFNIRYFLLIKKEYNTKSLGLLLDAYSELYKTYKKEHFKEKADNIFKIIKSLKNNNYNYPCWSYYFSVVHPKSTIEKNTPTVIHQSIITRGIYNYIENVNNSNNNIEFISSIKIFIEEEIYCYEKNNIFYWGYYPNSKICVYNASLHVAEIYSYINKFEPNEIIEKKIIKAINFVIEKQNLDGSWNYSFDPISGIEKIQIDFHQGFIIESLINIYINLNLNNENILNAIKKGAMYYETVVFKKNGVSYWRVPKEYPIDIHNQSQGIITFQSLYKLTGNKHYIDSANNIANWTINNMQSKKGYFYYRINKLYKNKISYIRWSQSWMLLALSKFQLNEDTNLY